MQQELTKEFAHLFIKARFAMSPREAQASPDQPQGSAHSHNAQLATFDESRKSRCETWRRAVIGSSARKAVRSLAKSEALAYRASGSFSRVFRQIVSRSDGTAGLSLLGGGGSRPSPPPKL